MKNANRNNNNSGEDKKMGKMIKKVAAYVLSLGMTLSAVGMPWAEVPVMAADSAIDLGEGWSDSKGIEYVDVNDENKTVSLLVPADIQIVSGSLVVPAIVKHKEDDVYKEYSVNKVVLASGDNMPLYGLEKVYVNANLEHYDSTFSGAKSLKFMEFGENVTTIPRYVAESVATLETVKLSSNTKELSAYAFKDCVKLKDITLPNGLKKIGQQAFYGCTSLEYIEIPESVDYIDYGAFDACDNLKIVIPSEQWLDNVIKNVGKDRAGFKTNPNVHSFKDGKCTLSGCGKCQAEALTGAHVFENDVCKVCKGKKSCIEGKHDFSTYVYNNDATCGKNGTETAKCSCGALGETREKAGTALTHTWGSSVYKDCKEAGKREVIYTCINCKEKKSVIEADPAYNVEQKVATVKVNGKETKIEVTTGVPTIPKSLKDAGLDSEKKIAEKMTAQVTKSDAKYKATNFKLYDVELKMNVDGKDVVVTADNFPKDGVKIVMSYPDGTNAAEYDFAVSHMVTVDKNGLKAGDVELPEVNTTEDGIEFTVKSLSPIGISWKKANTTSDAPKTGVGFLGLF